MTKAYSYVEHNLRNFYQTGFEKNNNISLRYGNEKVGVVASYGNLSSNGYHSEQRRPVCEKYLLAAWIHECEQAVARHDHELCAQGYQPEQRHVYGTPPDAVDVDYSVMKDYNDERYNLDNYYTLYATNPYYMIDNYRSNYQDDRVYGRIELSYDIMKGLKATGRLGGDFSNNRTTLQEPKYSFTDGSPGSVQLR